MFFLACFKDVCQLVTAIKGKKTTYCITSGAALHTFASKYAMRITKLSFYGSLCSFIAPFGSVKTCQLDTHCLATSQTIVPERANKLLAYVLKCVFFLFFA